MICSTFKQLSRFSRHLTVAANKQKNICAVKYNVQPGKWSTLAATESKKKEVAQLKANDERGRKKAGAEKWMKLEADQKS